MFAADHQETASVAGIACVQVGFVLAVTLMLCQGVMGVLVTTCLSLPNV